MWKHKICIGTGGWYGLTKPELFELFKEIGFDGFFTGWRPGYNIKECRELADRYGLFFHSLHAPFGYTAEMWQRCDEAGEAVGEYIACLRDCAENGVPIMILHAYYGLEQGEPTEVGLENYGKVIAEAERLGVKIAFENTEGEQYLAALMEYFGDSPAVGFCWDSGHEMCFNHGVVMLALYGKKMICTHLHDNLGIKSYDGEISYADDLHLLPFDGVADWKEIAARLDRESYTGELTLEERKVCKNRRLENRVYEKMDVVDYLTEAYKRACRIAALRKI